jgi:hypothetical protein
MINPDKWTAPDSSALNILQKLHPKRIFFLISMACLNKCRGSNLVLSCLQLGVMNSVLLTAAHSFFSLSWKQDNVSLDCVPIETRGFACVYTETR